MRVTATLEIASLRLLRNFPFVIARRPQPPRNDSRSFCACPCRAAAWGTRNDRLSSCLGAATAGHPGRCRLIRCASARPGPEGGSWAGWPAKKTPKRPRRSRLLRWVRSAFSDVAARVVAAMAMASFLDCAVPAVGGRRRSGFVSYSCDVRRAPGPRRRGEGWLRQAQPPGQDEERLRGRVAGHGGAPGRGALRRADQRQTQTGLRRQMSMQA